MDKNLLSVAGESSKCKDSKTSIIKTGNGKLKVPLKPGRGLLDWIRLSNAGRMTPYPPARSVDHNELSRHDSEHDCWILLFDTVYDVTRYMEFHPGGIPQLMRAAGTDATEIFNEIHRWVNYKNMLKNCVIGPFNGQREKCIAFVNLILYF
ncbi:Cytochrome b5 heme-binding domain-containing protein [Meloidogyne graminicola]|uniref:Cytochrome b5 heme-binding domain-containing protein n=1 Tax=Meloidogyne graminicola TaxID=189291 RepID=A0A8S9ZK16_9BILA|nr:Cytochrome b5 heme-binding domain-containing protein [Meloidogyne graminicola]